ncbi:MAG: malate dehydrogenase [Nitrospirae bacterium]|nr:malate dehydrogenase [Nitrospirota bacterium]
MNSRVSVIGAGNVGASLAQMIVQSGISDCVLFDIMEGVPQGKALDLSEACPLWSSASSIKGTSSYEDTAESDVVIITAGFPRKPGMSRDDLLTANAEVVSTVAQNAAKYSPDAVFIVVTNPMDVMTQVAFVKSGFKHEKVIGMGAILDSARFRTFVAWELGVSCQDVEALVLGGHGDLMVPMPRFTTVKGVSITELLSADRIDALVQRTRQGGAEIVVLLKTGSAYYAPAASAFEMVKCILLDEKRMLPCAAYLNGQYGVNGYYAGVPVVLGRSGVEKIIELKFNEQEIADFDKSIKSVQELVQKLGI